MTLLLIPGFMADATLWDAMTDDLAHFGPLVATDLSRGEDIESMAAAILSDAPDRFVAVGFSMGGYVARELARIAPDRVTALILIATSARGDTEDLIRQRRSALKAAPKSFKGLSRPAIVSSLHPDLAADEAEELHQGIAGSTLVQIADSGHMIPLEQPLALARAMKEWLAGLAG